jgi:outer membrane protein
MMQLFRLNVRSFWFLLALAIAPLCTVQSANLSDVYQLATEYDADIAAAVANHTAAIQRVPIAKSAFRPQVNAAFNAGINDGTPDGDGNYQDSLLTLSINQSLFNAPNRALLRQARAGVSQADAQLAAQQQNLILRATDAYFGVLRAQVGLRFSQSELQAIGRTREQAERRFDVGLVPVTDVREAQAQYDLAFAQKIAAENELESSREALFLVTGDADMVLNTLAVDLPLSPPDPTDIESWVKLAMENNPDLVVARMASQSAKFGVDAERGARLPTLDLVALASKSETEYSGRPDAEAGELRLEVRLPIYTGGRVKALVNQASAESASANIGLVSQERLVAQRTRDAFRGVVTSISRVKALQQALASTRKSAQATDAGFRAGTRTSVDVLRALRDTYSAQSDYAGARYDYIINALNLRAAAGTLTADDLLPIDNFLVEPQ